MKQIIWLSFDLGIRGDYEGLYRWLDEKGAKECGDNCASLAYRHDGEGLSKELKESLEKYATFDHRTRIYLIYKHPVTSLIKGQFLYGSRKSSPWTGYAMKSDPVDEGS